MLPSSKKIKDVLRFLNRTDGSLKGKTIRSSFWIVVGNAGLAVLSVIRTVILARLLAPEVFGLMGICMIVKRGIDIFTETGLPAALIHRQDRFEEAKRTAFTMLVIRGFIIALIVILIAPLVASYFEHEILQPCIQIMGIGFIFAGFTNIDTVAHRKELNFKSLTYIAQVTSVLSLVIVVTLAYFYRNIWALVVGQLLTGLASAILSYVIISGKPQFSFDKELAKELLGYGKFITGVAILGFIASEVDNAVVGKVLGVEALGFYVIAYQLASLPATHFSKVAARLMFPVCSKLQDDLSALRTVYLKAVVIVGHLAVPIAVGIATLAPEIVGTLYGNRWLPAAAPLQVLCLYGGVMALSSWGYVFNALGMPQIPFYLNVIRAVGIATLIYPLTTRYGIVGAAWSVAIPMLIQFVCQVVLVSKALQLDKLHFLKVIVGIVLNSAIMGILLWLAKQVDLESSLLSLALLAFVGIGSYLALNHRHLRAAMKGARGVTTE